MGLPGAHPTAEAERAANAQRLKPTDWPDAVVELYLGRSTPEAVRAAPGIAEWQLRHADRRAAIEALKRAVSTCPKDFVEATDA